MEPKRRKLEEIVPPSFAQWTIIFMCLSLECDMPILEALYIPTFVHFDLFLAMDPRLLWGKLKTNPRKHRKLKLEWWIRFTSFAIPLIERLFPKGSRFRLLRNWVKCDNCVELPLVVPHYPYFGGAGDEWNFSCRNVSVSRELKRFSAIPPPMYWIEERIRARTILERSETIEYHIRPLPGLGSDEEILLAHGWDILPSFNTVRITVSDWLDCRFSVNCYSFSFTDLCALLKIPKVLNMQPAKKMPL